MKILFVREYSEPMICLKLLKRFSNQDSMTYEVAKAFWTPKERELDALTRHRFVEDIGRHNAADIIGGHMLLNKIHGAGKQLDCTGRLTSEIVVKAARMKISTLLSRSGITRLGLEIAQELNITLIARAKGTHFLVYHGHDTILYEAPSKDAL